MVASQRTLRIEAVLWLVVMVAAILFSALLLVRNARQGAQIEDLQADNSILAGQVLELQNRCAEYERQIKEQPGLLPWEIEELQKKGLGNPLYDLAADLQRHPELIPHKGVLGGTMAFGFPEKIHVLTDKYALAYFEDGHIAGWMLLEYGVSKGGKIYWRVIDSYLD